MFTSPFFEKAPERKKVLIDKTEQYKPGNYLTRMIAYLMQWSKWSVEEIVKMPLAPLVTVIDVMNALEGKGSIDEEPTLDLSNPGIIKAIREQAERDDADLAQTAPD